MPSPPYVHVQTIGNINMIHCVDLTTRPLRLVLLVREGDDLHWEITHHDLDELHPIGPEHLASVLREYATYLDAEAALAADPSHHDVSRETIHPGEDPTHED